MFLPCVVFSKGIPKKDRGESWSTEILSFLLYFEMVKIKILTILNINRNKINKKRQSYLCEINDSQK